MSKPQRIYDGGPAFPETRWDNDKRKDIQWQGMTLRDWFAGQALAGLLSDHTRSGRLVVYADVAYEMADAMLEAREEQP